MSNLTTVFRREINAYWNSSIAAIFIIVFVLINAGLFMTQFFLVGRAEMRSFFMMLPFLLSVFLPAVTMRLWAEEKRGNTLELLLTFPMSTHALVLGKFLASFVFYLAALAATLPVAVMLRALGTPDMGAILGGYLGSAFLGAFYLAIGIFVSGLVADQIVAFILAMLACFALHLLGMEFLSASIDGWWPGLGTFLQEYVGSASRFEAFGKGVIDGRDLIYFALGTGLFLSLNGFWLEGRMRPRAKAIFASAAAIGCGIFLMTNWFLGDVHLGRFDLTRGRLYTVSDATVKIFHDLKAPVLAKLYISPSEKMPAGMKTLEQDVVGKLEEFRVASGGRFQYKVFHMEAANITDPEAAAQQGQESAEAKAQNKGIVPFQVQSVEADEMGVRLVYSTLTLAYKEKPEEVIPQIMPDSIYNLEYLVASKIFRMTLAEKPKIAMVAPFQEQAMDPNMAALLMQLGGGKIPDRYRQDEYQIVNAMLEEEGYEVARVRLDEQEPLPEGVKTLIVLEPTELTDRQRFEINRFLVGGGSVFLGVQQYEFDYDPTGGRLKIVGRAKKPEINPLLEAWGVELDANVLADEQNEVISIAGGAQLGPFAISVPVKAPIHILVASGQMNKDLSITSQLPPLFYLWGSALKLDAAKLKSEGLETKMLFESSAHSWTVPFSEAGYVPRDLTQDKAIEQGPFPLAVWVKGQFADAYAGKPVPAWPAPQPEPGAPAPEPQPQPTLAPVTPAPGNLIVTGDATMFQKHLIQVGGHLNFIMNAVDVLTLGEGLVSIRSKQAMDPTLGRISTAQKLFWRLFVTFFSPLVIAGLWAMRVLWRRRAKQAYVKSLAAIS
ncbi:MAG TPA: Gldg family protein [Verrucomicrobiae bacterium]|jgi:ABC-type uncharacterized transport system involved in gliding motility auxiliary subunit|nr:Gldg family protein [Verrucomicrobiae bacterium]